MNVRTESFPAPALRLQEVFRYAGCRQPSPQEASLARSCLNELEGQLVYRVCYLRCPCPPAADAPDFLSAHAAALAQPLHGCQELYIFAATVGLGLDRLIGKYSRLAPAKALFFQAIGAERIEALCDQFCAALKKRLQTEGLYLRPRFSPGYGAFPLAAQREIFRLLDCPKRIGLTLNESLLMSPSKSVTALAGISPCPPASRQQGCQSCTKTDCVYKR